MDRGPDDADTPLHDVTFCVVDVETTGGSPETGAITEIGAATFRGGERLGTFQTMVNPGVPVSPTARELTGISDAMLAPAPPIGAVLPSLLEFVRGAVLVGHNVRFDTAFLDAALALGDRAPLLSPRIDTVPLARRLLGDEVPDCRLATLAAHLRLDHRPTHRALADALATADLLHALIERAAAFGATSLGDLLALHRLAAHPQAAKLRLTAPLPRAPGVYLFRSRRGDVLHVGDAADVRQQVRTYFSPDAGSRTASLLREVATIDHLTCTSPLEAAVLRVRLVHALDPPFDRDGDRRRRSAHWMVLTGEPFPRLAVTRSRPRPGLAALGPFPSAAAAREVARAVESVVPLPRGTAESPDAAPSAGGPPPRRQPGPRHHCRRGAAARDGPSPAETVARGLGGEPHLLVAALQERIPALARLGRYGEAAAARDRLAVLVAALDRHRRIDRLRRAGRVVLRFPDGSGVALDRGRLSRAWGRGGSPGPASCLDPRAAPRGRSPAGPPAAGLLGAGLLGTLRSAEAGRGTDTDGHRAEALTLDAADEVWCVASWLDRHADNVRLVEAEGGLATPLPALPAPLPPDAPLATHEATPDPAPPSTPPAHTGKEHPAWN